MKSILFICTGNSARSIIAESIINKNYSKDFKAYSAGSNPSGKINPHIKEYLITKKYDVSNLNSKNFNVFLKDKKIFDYVVTVCSSAHNEICPIWPNKNIIIHWDIKDPVKQIESLNLKKKSIDVIIDETYKVLYRKITDWTQSEKNK